MKPGRSKALLLAGGVIASFALAELIVRIFLPEVSDTFITEIRYVGEKYHHPPQFRLRHALDRQKIHYRVLFLGDSFTWGMGAADSSFPYQFEDKINRLLGERGSKTRVEVFNLGSPSYSPSIYGVILRDYFSRIHPDLVVFALDDSDPQDDFLYREMIALDSSGLPLSVYPKLLGVPPWLVKAARYVKLIRLVLGRIHLKRKMSRYLIPKPGEAHLFAIENRLGHYRREWAPMWTKAIQRTLDLTETGVRFCVERGSEVLVINYPYSPAVTLKYDLETRTRFQLDSAILYKPLFHQISADWSKKNHIKYYNLTPYLNSLESLPGVYLEGDGHFSGLGNYMFADELVREILPLIH